MGSIDFSIIILNKNNENLLNCINSIKSQNYDMSKVELIIETKKLPNKLENIISKLEIAKKINISDDLDIASRYNNSKKFCEGKIIHFTTSDIIMKDKNVLKTIQKMSLEYNIIVCNMEYYDNEKKTPIKYVLSSTKENNYNVGNQSGEINTCLESFFINSKIIKQLYFDKKFGIECREKFIIDLFSLEQNYYNLGKIKLLSYFPYEDNTSKNTIQYNYDWYIPSLENWISFVKKEKSIPLYNQEIIMYIIYAKYNCNIDDRNKNILDQKDFKIFETKTKELLSYISYNTILQTPVSVEYRRVSHRFKINRALKLYFYNLTKTDGNKVYISGTHILEKNDNQIIPILNLENEIVNVYAINYKENKLTFDCVLCIKDYLSADKIKLKITYGGKEINYTNNNIYNLMKLFDKTFNKKYFFKFTIDLLNNFNDLKVFLIYDNKEYQLNYNFVKVQARLSSSKRSYWNYKDFTVENKKNKLTISKSSLLKTLKLETFFFLSKLKNENNKIRVCKLEALRFLYIITKPFLKNRNILITFDKLYKAGDNGEYIYQYGIKNKRNIYYIIKKDSYDYKRLKRHHRNRIIKYNSLKAKLYSLHATAILDTHANAISYCGFEGMARDFVAGLFNAKIICIAHGLTMQDIAQYQNRLFDNINLYCVASKYEKINLLKEIYDYDEDQIKVIGMARFDGLINNDKRIILITPTWRRSLVNSSVAHEKKQHNNNFKNSDYFKIYNSLINNKDLLNSAKKNNYKILYLLHPAMSSQIDDFDKNEYVDIIPASGNISYEKILTESSLMITDYSGVQYDFAYMKKPIIYYHPEKLPPHYANGMMDYEKMGFGPICKNEKSIIETICSYMDNNCIIHPEYKKRTDNFFEYIDTNNCKRIFNEIDNYFDNLGGNK